MKRSILSLLLVLMCNFIYAQNLYVYSTTGTAEIKKNGNWQKLKRRDVLQNTDIIRVLNNSALSILDKNAEKIYSLSKTDEKEVQKAIEAVKDKQPNISSQFFNHAMKSMFKGETDKISYSAAGCTYRGDIVESEIAKMLISKQKGTSLKTVANERTDYAVSFEIVSRENNTIIKDNSNIGYQTYFRIKNNSSTAIYVNILDIDSDGEKYSCLPMDDAQTMSHLLIPANSTIDLTDFPMEFTEPVGTDCFILVANTQPFDLRVVETYLNKLDVNSVKSAKKAPLGIYKKYITIK